MSLLQENIIYILLLPVVLQIFLPLAMLAVYLVSLPCHVLFRDKQSSEYGGVEELDTAKNMA